MSDLPDTHDASAEGVPLVADEIVLANRHPSLLNWWGTIQAAFCIELLGLTGLSLGDIGASLPFVGGGVLIGGSVVLARRRSRYVVTTKRVYAKVGLFRRTTSEAQLAEIHSLSTDASLFERLLGQGTVHIDSTSIAGLVALTGTSDPERFANTIRQQQQAIAE